MKPFLCTFLLLLTASFASAADAAPETNAKPNIILIVGDDLGYADLSCQGLSKDVSTPNIDALASAGVRFTNGYVSCPVCSPTRAGLMTGRYQQRFGHEFNPGGAGGDNFGLPTDQTALADVLKKQGYTTALVGKWHLGHSERFLPQQRGFDEFFGFLSGAHSYVKHNSTILRGTEIVEEKEYLTDAFTREAVAFIDRNHDKPFFLYLPYNAVHTPLDKTPEKYLKGTEEIPDPKRKSFVAMLNALDAGVGQVMETLKKHGLDNEKTMVIFHTDNGGPTKGNSSRNEPLSGFKATVREGGVRVPSMIRWSKHIPAGKVEDAPMIQLDYFATIATAAGAGDAIKDLKLDGVDLVPYLNGNAEKPHQSLYWRYGKQWAVRDGNMKLFDTNDGNGVQLIDLSKDIAEANNLAGAQSDEVKRLQGIYDAWNSQNVDALWEQRKPATRQNQTPRKSE